MEGKEVTNKYPGTSMVMLTKNDYDEMVNKITDNENRVAQLGSVLEKYSEFMGRLDKDEKVLEMYNQALEDTGKIGSAFFRAFEKYNEYTKMKLV